MLAWLSPQKRRTLSVIRRLTVLAEDPSLLHVLVTLLTTQHSHCYRVSKLSGIPTSWNVRSPCCQTRIRKGVPGNGRTRFSPFQHHVTSCDLVLLQHACSTLNIDIISLDLSQRIPFYMKYPQVSQVHAILKRVHGTILSYYHTCRQWSEVCILKSAMAQPSEVEFVSCDFPVCHVTMRWSGQVVMWLCSLLYDHVQFA